jgi:hypothetical protein
MPAGEVVPIDRDRFVLDTNVVVRTARYVKGAPAGLRAVSPREWIDANWRKT